MRRVTIYSLTDSLTKEVRYIGKTRRDPKLRLWEHEQSRGNFYVSRWIRALQNLGGRPEMTILEICSESDWEEREKFWISKFKNDQARLTNLAEGGHGASGYVADEETRLKRSIQNLGRLYSPATRKKMSDSHKKLGPPKCAGWNKGMKTSEAKIRTGRTRDEYFKSEDFRTHQRKISKLGVIASRGRPSPNLGVPMKEETKEKIRKTIRSMPQIWKFKKGQTAWNKGLHWSDEIRQKISNKTSGSVAVNRAKKGWETRRKNGKANLPWKMNRAG